MNDILFSDEAFANTYRPTGYASGWAAVEAYRAWQVWQSHHPDAGRTAAGTALEMPPGRIRVWQNGGKPDPVRGLETAAAFGWRDATLDTDVSQGLIRLLAWVYSSGSLPPERAVQYTPRFSVRSADEESRLEHWAGMANIDIRYREPDNEHSGEEAVPIEGGNPLGRTLIALGAEPGGSASAYDRLPLVITKHRGTPVEDWFVATYLRNRGQLVRRWLQMREVRNEAYLTALGGLFEEAVDTPVTVSASHIRLDRDAVVTFLEAVDDIVGPEEEW